MATKGKSKGRSRLVHDLVPSKIEVQVSQTIQVRQYEPLTVTTTEYYDVPEGVSRKTYEAEVLGELQERLAKNTTVTIHNIAETLRD